MFTKTRRECILVGSRAASLLLTVLANMFVSCTFSDRRFRTSIAGLLGLIWTMPAAAHNPGLGVAELQVREDGLIARLTLAQRSIDAVLGIDINGDGALSSAELESARPRLSVLAADLLVIRSEGEHLTSRVVAIDIDQKDGLNFLLAFSKPGSGRLEVSAPRIAAFARGYRQFVSVIDASGDKHTGMLSADRASLEVNLRGGFDPRDLSWSPMRWRRGASNWPTHPS